MICILFEISIELSFRSKTIPKDASPLMLQDLIEKVMILKKAVEREKKQVATSSVLADQLRYEAFDYQLWCLCLVPSFVCLVACLLVSVLTT